MSAATFTAMALEREDDFSRTIAAARKGDLEAFELLAEVSPKNGYRFGLSMEFADRAAYEGYNEHADHVRFVQERWLAEVSDFLELDYVAC